MSKEIITVGKVGGEEWVGTNKDGIGKLLFKLQDAKEVREGLNKAHEHAKELGCSLYQAEKENAALREALRLKELECEALAGDKEAMQEVLVECMGALEMSYDVNDYPANGKTVQDAAVAKSSELLSKLGGSDEK